MQLDTHCFWDYRSISLHGLTKILFCTFLNALVCALHTLRSIHIILIRKISGKISCLKIHRFRKIKRFNRFHKVISHLGRTIDRNTLKTDTATSCHRIITRFGIIIITITPSLYPRGFKTRVHCRICIKKPKRYIHAFDFINMVLILKYFGEKPLSTIMSMQRFLCCLFIQLKRNHVIRL